MKTRDELMEEVLAWNAKMQRNRQRHSVPRYRWTLKHHLELRQRLNRKQECRVLPPRNIPK